MRFLVLIITFLASFSFNAQIIDVTSKEKQQLKIEKIIAQTDSIYEIKGPVEAHHYLIKQELPFNNIKIETLKKKLITEINIERKNQNSHKNVRFTLEKVQKNKKNVLFCRSELDSLDPKKIEDKKLRKKCLRLKKKYLKKKSSIPHWE